MLETGDLGGKCADLNALYVGLARAAGIPARDLYGIRVAPSRFGYKSLGANSDVITRAQHCRAENYLAQCGWVPVDPADVRKVVLEEPPGHLSVDDAKVEAARNAVRRMGDELDRLQCRPRHRVAGFARATMPFLMYPQGKRRRAARLPRSGQLPL